MTNLSPSWHDLQYLPSLTVKDAASVAPGWRRRAALAREKHQPFGDFKYGPHPRESIDLFRVEGAKGCLVYVHGGYWRSFSKWETSFVATGFVEDGFSVALINYPLCPDVTIADIRHSVQRAFAHLWLELLTPDEKRRIVVTGHSAGGHLAVLHMATDWPSFGPPQDPLAGVISLSGVFDVAPLQHTSMNGDLRITDGNAAAINLTMAKPLCHCPLVLAVGGDESAEFHRQSEAQAKAWAVLSPQLIDLPGFNHYTIVDSLADRAGVLHSLATEMLRG